MKKKLNYFLTLHLHFTHLTMPFDGILGCHSSPFSYTLLITWHPPLFRMSSISLAELSSASWVGLGVLVADSGGHTLQHASLSGRIASFSEHVNGGHWLEEHLTSNVNGWNQTEINKKLTKLKWQCQAHWKLTYFLHKMCNTYWTQHVSLENGEVVNSKPGMRKLGEVVWVSQVISWEFGMSWFNIMVAYQQN